MHAMLNGKIMNEAVARYRRSFDRQLHRIERQVVSHPERGLLVALVAGVLLGIWIKRK
jgi:hypothetical protein